MQTSELKKKRQKRLRMRRIRRVLAVLLPLLFLVLLALLIARSRITAPEADKTDTADQTASGQTPAQDDRSDEPTAAEPDGAEAVEPDTDDTGDTEPVSEPAEPVTIVFTGDVLLSDYVLDNYRADGISGVLSPELLNALTDADLTVINNEFPFSTRGTKAPDKQFTFRVDPQYVSVLTDMGTDIAGLANNHVLDYGADALLDTFDTLDQAGIDYLGAGTDPERAGALITKEINGQTFGFLAASRVIPVVEWDVRNCQPGVFTTYDPTLLLTAIREATEQCDYLTVLVHWGIERDEYPQDYQTQLARQYIDAGADLIIGAHPHVLQGISFYKDKPIFYSLGNFIFNQTIARTAAVRLTVDADGTASLQLIPAAADGARTYVLEDPQAQELYRYMEQISDDGLCILSDGTLQHTAE